MLEQVKSKQTLRERRKCLEVINGKITKATQSELFSYYLTRGWDDVMSFPDYLRGIKENGTIVTVEESKEKIRF